MPARHITSRFKLHYDTYFERPEDSPHESAHHQFSMYFSCSSSSIVSIGFVVGSMCFLKEAPPVAAVIGVWIFLFAAGFSFFQSAHDVLETQTAYKQGLLTEEGRDEFFESIFYMVSNAIFFAGCFPFMPGLVTAKNEAPAHEVGAWLFTLGSFGFVMAAYFNSLGLSSIPAEKGNESSVFIRRLATSELLLTILGSVLFVVGSILYRPSLDTRCAERTKASLLATGAQHAKQRPQD